ncbi:hypothetical protein NYY93_30465, partial [Acinetobacter baumannii]|nr:hypothetical protein [Acinetobacter baumannii]
AQIQSGVGARTQEDTAAPDNFKPEVWHKNNKALIKAGNLKAFLGYPTCKLFGFTSAILKIEDEKIC